MGSTKEKEDPKEGQTKEGFLDVSAARIAYSTDLQRIEKERTPKQTYSISRELMGQLTPSRPVQGNLFSMLEPEGLSDEAKKYEEQDKLFSIITDGISAGAVGKKVVLYIARELYRQAALFAKDGNPLKYGFDGIVEHARKMGFYAERKIGGKALPCVFINVKLSEATKWVKGTNQTKNRIAIDGMIHRLCDNIVFWKSPDNKKHLKVNVISIESEFVNEITKQKEYILEVKPIFYSSIAKGFITASESTSRLVPKLRGDLQTNLFCYLLLLHSFKNTKDYPVVKRSAEIIEARVIPDYYIKDNRKKDLKKDFDKAVAKMIKGGLLTDEGITYEIGKNGVTRYYVFHLNPHYNDTTTPLLLPD